MSFCRANLLIPVDVQAGVADGETGSIVLLENRLEIARLPGVTGDVRMLCFWWADQDKRNPIGIEKDGLAEAGSDEPANAQYGYK